MNVGGTIPIAGVLKELERQAGESHMSGSSSALTLLLGYAYHVSHEGLCPFLYHEQKLIHNTILIKQPLITIHF